MSKRDFFSEKDLIIFCGFLIMAIGYILCLAFRGELIIIKVIMNYVSFNLIQFAIIKEAHVFMQNDFDMLNNSIANGEIDIVESNFNKFVRASRIFERRLFIGVMVFVTILSGVQFFIKGNVQDIIGDLITFSAFVLSCESFVFSNLIYLWMYKKVFGFNKKYA